MRVGNAEYDTTTVTDLLRRQGIDPDTWAVNVDVWADEIENSDDQREGWHLLLSEWFKLDPAIAKNVDQLKTKVLMLKFGAAKVTDQHGNETFIPLRRSTQVFDFDKGGYRRKKLSKKLYSELIEFTYELAAQDGTVLPELKRQAA